MTTKEIKNFINNYYNFNFIKYKRMIVLTYNFSKIKKKRVPNY